MAVVSFLRLLCICCAISTLRLVSAVSSLCPSQSLLFLNHLQSQCPKAFSPSTPLQVDGDFLDGTMSFKQLNGTTSILFYASWCPFSRHAQSLFDVLSSMFPQITHLAVEESKVMPNIFSKYGIHSFPSILIMNRTLRIRYYGSKDLDSLVLFYKRSTGFEPIEHFVNSQPISSGAEKPCFLLDGSLGELLRREPYLIFSVLFLCLKGFLHFFPQIVARLNAFWVSCILHLNLGIFGETNHVLKRVLHVIDVKMAWSKLRRCKTRNFHNRAKSARVWATSLASVSLGESSSRDS